MKEISVITGGGSGMGLATAKILGKENLSRSEIVLHKKVMLWKNLRIIM